MEPKHDLFSVTTRTLITNTDQFDMNFPDLSSAPQLMNKLYSFSSLILDLKSLPTYPAMFGSLMAKFIFIS